MICDGYLAHNPDADSWGLVLAGEPFDVVEFDVDGQGMIAEVTLFDGRTFAGEGWTGNEWEVWREVRDVADSP